MGRSVSTKKSIVSRNNSRTQVTPVRYAVVGLGYIAQVAVMPAFAHAKRNSELTALVSDDPQKLKQSSRRYEVPYCYSYRQYDQCLREGHIDAVYIALPNSLHCDYAVRAAKAGVHVLCEKPMAVTEHECRRMIQAADQAGTKLMVAYRLHFEEGNMNTVELAQSGKLGNLRLFNSVFTMQVREGNIRVEAELGGGSLYETGVFERSMRWRRLGSNSRVIVSRPSSVVLEQPMSQRTKWSARKGMFGWTRRMSMSATSNRI